MSNIRLFLTNKLSQWTRSPFVIDGIRYNCCEQYMMAEKARLFKDNETFKKIMEVDPALHHSGDSPYKEWTDYPRRQKELGREVKGFSKEEWEKVAQDVVYKCNLAKFSQNEELWKFLDNTGDDILAESNPKDQIWGIGLKRDDPRAMNQTTWQGKNWLGFALMKAREQIRADRKESETNLLNLITSEVGYEVDLFGTLYLRPLEDLTFAVGSDDKERGKEYDWEKCFTDPKEAVKFFEDKRREMGLGWDFERYRTKKAKE